MPTLVPLLRSQGELDISDSQSELLSRISAATIDRMLKESRAEAKFPSRPRTRTKPGSLRKTQTTLFTFADWDETTPGFIQIDFISHDGNQETATNYCHTILATDTATGWTAKLSYLETTEQTLISAIDQTTAKFPFPIFGISSTIYCDSIINYCQQHRFTLICPPASRTPTNCHLGSTPWSQARELVGYSRYDTHEALQLLNKLWELDDDFTNYFLPILKLAFKRRNGDKVVKKHDEAATAHQRTVTHFKDRTELTNLLETQFRQLHLGDLHRQITNTISELEQLAHQSSNEGPASHERQHRTNLAS